MLIFKKNKRFVKKYLYAWGMTKIFLKLMMGLFGKIQPTLKYI